MFGILCLSFIGCAQKNKVDPEEKKPSPPPKLVGIVISKNTKKNYVLIEYYGTWKYEEQTELTTEADGRSGVLMTSGEKLGPYIAADIESGLVDVGDAVYFQQTTSEDVTENQSDQSETPAEKPTSEVIEIPQ